jgi:uncharacterized protein (DUF1697 family)
LFPHRSGKQIRPLAEIPADFPFAPRFFGRKSHPAMTGIALLRGINVSGHRPVPMARLREVLESAGLGAVRTYLQSGNVVFTAIGKPDKSRRLIEAAIERDFGFPVPVILRDAAEWEKILAANPFFGKPGVDPEALYVTFLDAPPPAVALRKLDDLPDSPDAFQRIGNEIHLHCPGGYGRTKLSNAAFERKLGVGATTRNWKTVNALAAMAAEGAA